MAETLAAAPAGPRRFRVNEVTLQWMAQDLCHAIVEDEVPRHLLEAADELCSRLEELADQPGHAGR
jgi:hypothetical protein